MTLEEYLQHKINELAAHIAAEAPVDSCPDCNLCEGRLTYNGETNTFVYACQICGQTWPADNLEIDCHGKFQMLEFAD